MPDDVARIFNRSTRQPRSENNILCFVLDSNAKLLHIFNAFRGKTPVSPRGSAAELASYFTSQIQHAMTGTRLASRKWKGDLVLPDIENGVRIFIRSYDRRGFLDNDPIVEVEPMTAADWEPFSFDHVDQKFTAATLEKWLAHVYPNAQRGVPPLIRIRSISGELKLQSAGADIDRRYAILHGNFHLEGNGRSDRQRSDQKYSLSGSIEAVLTYNLDSPDVRSVRLVVHGVYPSTDRGVVRNQRLSAAIESRPE